MTPPSSQLPVPAARPELQSILSGPEFQPRSISKSYAEQIFDVVGPALRRNWNAFTDWFSSFFSPSSSPGEFPEWLTQLLDVTGQVLMYAILVSAAGMLLFVVYKIVEHRRMPLRDGKRDKLPDAAPATSADMHVLLEHRRVRELLFALRSTLRTELAASLPVSSSTTDRQLERIIPGENSRKVPFEQIAQAFEGHVFREEVLNEELVRAAYDAYRVL